MGDKPRLWDAFFQDVEDPRGSDARSVEARLLDLERRIAGLEAARSDKPTVVRDRAT